MCRCSLFVLSSTNSRAGGKHADIAYDYSHGYVIIPGGGPHLAVFSPMLSRRASGIANSAPTVPLATGVEIPSEEGGSITMMTTTSDGGSSAFLSSSATSPGKLLSKHEAYLKTCLALFPESSVHCKRVNRKSPDHKIGMEIISDTVTGCQLSGVKNKGIRKSLPKQVIVVNTLFLSDAGSAGRAAGIQCGDVIVSANNVPLIADNVNWADDSANDGQLRNTDHAANVLASMPAAFDMYLIRPVRKALLSKYAARVPARVTKGGESQYEYPSEKEEGEEEGGGLTNFNVSEEEGEKEGSSRGSQGSDGVQVSVAAAGVSRRFEVFDSVML